MFNFTERFNWSWKTGIWQKEKMITEHLLSCLKASNILKISERFFGVKKEENQKRWILRIDWIIIENFEYDDIKIDSEMNNWIIYLFNWWIVSKKINFEDLE